MLERLCDIAIDMPAISIVMEWLAARGVNLGRLNFEASYGRSHMEHYNGFLFCFYTVSWPDLPAVTSGGFYDALTQ